MSSDDYVNKIYNYSTHLLKSMPSITASSGFEVLFVLVPTQVYSLIFAYCATQLSLAGSSESFIPFLCYNSSVTLEV